MRSINFVWGVCVIVCMAVGQLKADVYEPDASDPTQVEPADAPLDQGGAPALQSTEKLKALADNCRKQVLDLHHLKSQVPKDKVRAYSIALGLAAEKCDAVTKAYLQLVGASQDYQIYHQNLKQAQSCVASNLSSHGEDASINDENGFGISQDQTAQYPQAQQSFHDASTPFESDANESEAKDNLESN